MQRAGTRLRAASACLLAAYAVGCAARSSIPRVSNKMYDWDLSPVVVASPMPIQCPPLPRGRRVRPPDRATPAVVECIDHYATIADDVLRQYESSTDGAVRSACEDILSRLWQRRRLPSAIKHRLVDRHVRVTIAQLTLPSPGLHLRVAAATSFRFPPAVFTVRVLRYRNGRAERGLDSSSRQAALSTPGQLTNHATGVYTRGDTYAYDIVLDEMVDNAVVWRKVVRTDWITVS